MTSKNGNSVGTASRKLEYFLAVTIGVIMNLFFMIVAAIVFPTISILLNTFVIPVPVTFLYCLFVSTQTQERVIVSPVFVMVGNLIVALIINGTTAFFLYRPPLFDPERALSAFNSTLYVTLLFFMIWFLFSIPLNRIIRAFIGAYAEADKIENSVCFYTSKDSPSEILYQIEKKDWLNDVCGLEVVDEKEEESSIKLRLRKLKTDYYLGLYAKQEQEGKTTISLMPHRISEDYLSRIITSNEYCKDVLKYQIKELETQLNLQTSSKEKIRILPESINYVTSPARFPMFIKYRTQIAVTVAGILATLLLSGAFYTKTIDSTVFLSLLTIAVTAILTLLNLTSRRH